MICTVTTALESYEYLKKFAEANIRLGADHIFLFLDDGDHEKAAYLNNHPNITAIPTDNKYWGRNRPESLNDRQNINSNKVNYVLSDLDFDVWLASIDSDEFLNICKEYILNIKGKRYVKLHTYEKLCFPVENSCDDYCILNDCAIPENGRVDIFKRKLSDTELDLAVLLGLIGESSNSSYFNGHTAGKYIVKASKDIVMGVHNAKRNDGKWIASHKPEDMEFSVLHYDMPSFSIFLDKWGRHAHGAGSSSFRGARMMIKNSISLINGRLLNNDDLREKYLKKIYSQMVVKNIKQFVELDLLVCVDFNENYSPNGFSKERIDFILSCF
ncbi:hypothetical protein F0A16_02700 [Salinicola corii]|uniref:Glycosyl transferase family 2 n=1 Tax=Salinicola corii TaxID=2606937 RepID=A0A640WJG2_9GAMM|nr:glycosyltransferase family 2 protein [Salinicola corii]KAA0020715.1 hypothetical protein F0A16_02700 [Salinicola corii]